MRRPLPRTLRLAAAALFARSRCRARRRRGGACAAYGAGFGAFYLALAAAGALVGVSPAWLPLGPADHVFHALVGATSGALGLGLMRGPSADAGRQGR